MDFDDYDSYAPIRPDPPTPIPSPPRHRFRAAAIVLGVLAIAFVAVQLVGTEDAKTVAAVAPVTSSVAPDTRPAPTMTTLIPAVPAGQDTTVARVIDGDTIEVAGGTRIRLIGIDTPETTSSRGCFGPEATAETRRMLPADQRVRLVYDVDRSDTFGRTLAYVYTLPDGRFVNAALAREGFAVQATFPPNVAHVEELTLAVAEARNAGRGLWAACPSAAAVPLVAAPPATGPPVAAPPGTRPTTTTPLAARGAIGTVPATKPPATVKPSGAGAAYYANCTAARAAGAAPLRRGDAGYRSALDRDGDGVACE